MPEFEDKEVERRRLAEQDPPVPLTAEQQAEADRVAAQAEIDRLAPYHQAVADYNAHPHTQLTAINKVLAAPALDIHTRINTVHSAVSRLVQMMLAHAGNVPEKPEHPDEIKRRNEQVDAERPEGPIPASGRREPEAWQGEREF